MVAPTTSGKWPILIFSHGLGCTSLQYKPLLEKIASQGYVVLSLNHPSSSRFGTTDLEALDRLEISDPINHSKELDRLALTQADNIRFVMDQIREGTLRQIGSPDLIALAGHSRGGSASIAVSRTDPSIAGCINLDGALSEGHQPISNPVMTIFSDHLSDEEVPPEEQEVYQDWKENKYPPMLERWKTFHTHSSDSRVREN